MPGFHPELPPMAERASGNVTAGPKLVHDRGRPPGGRGGGGGVYNEYSVDVLEDLTLGGDLFLDDAHLATLYSTCYCDRKRAELDLRSATERTRAPWCRTGRKSAQI